MKFLQLNLGRGKGLLMQTIKERGADVLLISEQYKWSDKILLSNEGWRGQSLTLRFLHPVLQLG